MGSAVAVSWRSRRRDLPELISGGEASELAHKLVAVAQQSATTCRAMGNTLAAPAKNVQKPRPTYAELPEAVSAPGYPTCAGYWNSQHGGSSRERDQLGTVRSRRLGTFLSDVKLTLHQS